MEELFFNKNSFNADIRGWDVSKVTNMYAMFVAASAFNQAISSWDVSKVTNMRQMFNRASAFSQDLTTWCVVNVSDKFNFDTDSGLNTGQLPDWTLFGQPVTSCPA